MTGRCSPAAVALAAAAVAYSAWLLAGPMGSTLPARTSWVSELMAVGQPGALLFRTTDAVAGTLLMVAAWRWPSKGHPRWSVVARIAVAVFGLATVVDAANPMACAPSVDAACAAAEAAGDLPLHHTVHTVSSSVAGMALLMAAGAFSLAHRRWWLWLVAVALVLTTTWTMVEYAACTMPSVRPYALDTLGWAQRAQVVLAQVWLALAAHTLRTPQEAR